MKKILALLTAIIFIFSLCACSKKENNLSTADPTSSVSITADFTKPSDYASAVLLKINPQFKLYLDDTNKILAINALNNDAKSIKSNIDLSDTNFEVVIEKILKAANDKGFIKNDAAIDFEMVEVKNTVINIADILSKAAAVASKTSTELGLTITVNTADKTNSFEQTTSDSTESKTTSSEKADASSNKNNSNKTSSTSTTTNKVSTESKTTSSNKTSDATHTHKYTNATCTIPAKCSCGATNGSALGHTWQAATCKAPKTCKICKATEGSIGSHSYNNNKCIVCGAANNLNPKTDLKYDKEFAGNFRLEHGTLTASVVSFHNNDADGLHCLILSPGFEETTGAGDITFNNKNYNHYGAGMNPHYLELTDTEIIIKGKFENFDGGSNTNIKLILQSDGTLKVTSSNDDCFPVGTILSTNWQSTIK